jgi:thioredoxin-dependent peroxiredoxin
MPMSRCRRLAVAVLLSSAVLCMGASHVLALQVGDKAPDFTLPGTTAEEIKLADYVGKKPVVLFFYIGAFTKG